MNRAEDEAALHDRGDVVSHATWTAQTDIPGKLVTRFDSLKAGRDKRQHVVPVFPGLNDFDCDLGDAAIEHLARGPRQRIAADLLMRDSEEMHHAPPTQRCTLLEVGIDVRPPNISG